MNKWLNQFLTDFHKAHLKELGFRKVQHTFSRDMGAYWERCNFQGSTWHSAESEYWTFYLNVGLEFKDLEPQRNWSYFPHTHWAGRMETVVSSAPSAWDYNLRTDQEALMRDLLSSMLKASEKMAAEMDGLRRHYVEGQHLMKRYAFAEI
jgi:hypothetical protein